jgi:hypothetical protein
MNLHYGCGMCVGKSWYNCDASPTVWLQRLPVIGLLFQRTLSPRFPPQVHYGDIVSGLNLPAASCEVIFCSHVLEHLALDDLRTALRNTYAYLKPGGVFRLIVPDLEQCVAGYLSNSEPTAASNFMTYTHLGRRTRPRGLFGLLREQFGSPHHLWMWDYKGLAYELNEAGFTGIRRYIFADESSPAFREVEVEQRFEYSLGVECTRS